jgi:ribA/ribD-fused uncharacterized protein
MYFMTISNFSGEHAYLSNFYVRPLRVGSIVYTCGEQYFQSRKCLYVEDWQEVMTAAYPASQKRIGRHVDLRPDWESVKIPVMRKLLSKKFPRPGENLSERLLSTGNHDLVESNNWGDDFWGQVDGTGHNWLGHLLMARRAELRALRIIDLGNAPEAPVSAVLSHPDVKEFDRAERQRAKQVIHAFGGEAPEWTS